MRATQALRLAGQRPRAAECDRACRDPVPRRPAAPRCRRCRSRGARRDALPGRPTARAGGDRPGERMASSGAGEPGDGAEACGRTRLWSWGRGGAPRGQAVHPAIPTEDSRDPRQRLAMSLVTRHVDVGGHALRIETRGAGLPYFVCLHGLADTLSVWSRLAPALAARGQVVLVDQRAHGGSDAPRGPYRREDLATDIRAL